MGLNDPLDLYEVQQLRKSIAELTDAVTELTQSVDQIDFRRDMVLALEELFESSEGKHKKET